MWTNSSSKPDGVGYALLIKGGIVLKHGWTHSSHYTATSWCSLAMPPSATKASIRGGSVEHASPEYPVITDYGGLTK